MAVDAISRLCQTSAATARFTRASESRIMSPQKDHGRLRSELLADTAMFSISSHDSTQVAGSPRGALCFLCATKRIAFEMHLSMCFAAPCITTIIDFVYISDLSFLGTLRSKSMFI